ncbi:MAG: chlorophyll A-B-binding protein [Chamaesiphon sp.]|nr:chlorophyll A-B-binding protein [Chamaesiphon sp.]
MTSSSTKVIPAVNADRNQWRWGFTPQAEIWNGRFAMLGFVAALLTEYLSGQGVLHFYNLLPTVINTANTVVR